MLVLYQKDPIIAVFLFILIAIMIFIFLILIGAEFIALLISIIYAGVIIVLFLFTVIIYNLQGINFEIPTISFRKIVQLVHFITWKNILWVISIILTFLLVYSIWGGEFAGMREPCLVVARHTHLYPIFSLPSYASYTIDIIQLSCLFNKHSGLFLACGLLLFIAIIGSVVMTYSFIKPHSR